MAYKLEQIKIGTAAPKAVERPISPALVVGLGGTGKEVLLRLRRLIVERFGSLNALPCIEFLHIDTDQKQTAREQYDLKADDDALFNKVKFSPKETIPLKAVPGDTYHTSINTLTLNAGFSSGEKLPVLVTWMMEPGKSAWPAAWHFIMNPILQKSPMPSIAINPGCKMPVSLKQ